MIVRGIDPGTHKIAWCDLDFSTGSPVFVAMGEVSSATWPLLIADGYAASAFAVERAYGLRIGALASIQQAKKLTADLLETNWIACQIVHAYRNNGGRAFEVDQAEARRGVGVQFDKSGSKDGDMPTDAQVAVIVRGLVRGFPAKRHESNPDKRDAAVYALHGAHLLKYGSKEA